MELDKIKSLKEQIERMENTPTNLSNAISVLCSIVKDLIIATNSVQREVDDFDNYRMEQNERNA